MEGSLGLKELFQTLRKRIFLIILFTLIAMIVSGIVSYFVITPEYKSSTQILVNQTKDDESVYNYNEVQTNVQLISTYSVIIKSAAILNIVKNDLDLNMSVSELNERISVESAQNSQIMTVSVTDPDPALALEIANKTADVFEKEIKEIMSVDNVTILPLADDQENQSPISPNPTLNIVIGAVVGLFIGIGLAFLLEYLDNTVKTEQDIEKLLGVPVLGAITLIDDNFDARIRGTNTGRTRGAK
ncbi:Wzz/FepE/Etk N-terminal domain-containing protein [Niallia taxi]|uniref:YveK family protein n=1 Tax=Niallia taxi TaxID=2499688 RepID=UPI002E219309|nr:Wzz/FepE/Etk N-terminal domain-containing protein [Niallia taxi]MED4054182.1 Wzz/FepE/Etk N-terminal domain-containing protein [Niallia taxi]MED4118298.1 Wzz/FepE/Etk N-terminal domain-containing protein [Niallia taxi]